MDQANIMKDLVAGNACYLEHKDTGRYDLLAGGQQPRVTLVTCSDSRVPMAVLREDTVNYIFSIENIGNQIKTAEGSVDYGVTHLKTPLLVILGHTDCGAVKASFTDYSKDTSGIISELDTLSSVFDGVLFKDDRLKTDRYAEANVDFQVAYAVSKYRNRIDDGSLAVVGMMMDFNNSYGDKRCEVYITNVNGKTDIGEIRSSGALAGIDDDTLDLKVRRLTDGKQ